MTLNCAWPVIFSLGKMVLAFFRNEDSGKSDKAEKGTKVMRRLSSLRSRVTGSWQKDKVRERCTALLCARVLPAWVDQQTVGSARCNRDVLCSPSRVRTKSNQKRKRRRKKQRSQKRVGKRSIGTSLCQGFSPAAPAARCVPNLS